MNATLKRGVCIVRRGPNEWLVLRGRRALFSVDEAAIDRLCRDRCLRSDAREAWLATNLFRFAKAPFPKLRPGEKLLYASPERWIASNARRLRRFSLRPAFSLRTSEQRRLLSSLGISRSYRRLCWGGGVLEKMQALPGERLDLWLSRPQRPNERLRVVRALIRAVEDLHAQNHLHTDLHSGNVLVTRSLKVKLLDYDQVEPLGKEASIVRRKRPSVRGQCAPELFGTAPLTPACDGYALARLVSLILKKPLPRRFFERDPRKRARLRVRDPILL